MTNAIDVLAVGGPANGRVTCVKGSARYHMPATIEFISLDHQAGPLEYKLVNWWYPTMQRWFWIAMRDVDQVTDADIAWEVNINDFQPAWDLRNLPAPNVENGNA